MSRIEIFTPKQRMVMAKNMQPWLEEMYKKAAPNDFQKRLESLSVRYVPMDKGRFSSNSDRLKAQLVQEGVGDVGEPFEILLYSPPGMPYDKKLVEEQVCKAKPSHLSGHPGRSAYKGKGGQQKLEGLENSITTFAPEVLFEHEEWPWDAEGNVKLTAVAPFATQQRYEVLIPVSDEAEADYINLGVPAAAIATAACSKFPLLNSDAVQDNLKNDMEEKVKAIVDKAVADYRNDAEMFWDNLFAELDNKLALVKGWETEIQQVKRDWQKYLDSTGAGQLQDEPGGAGADIRMRVTTPPTGISTAFERIWDGLCRAFPAIGDGLAELPEKVYKGIAPNSQKMLDGIRFGLYSAGVVVAYAAIMCTIDAAAACFPFRKLLLGKQAYDQQKIINKFLAGRLLKPGVITLKYRGYETHAKVLHWAITAVKNHVYEIDPDGAKK